ncbi:CRTAC1 family protein [soil metagenome]
MRSLRALPVAFLPLFPLVAFFACAPTVATPAPGPSCDVHAAPKTSFEDRTAAWGFTGVVGNRLTNADLDGDGYPDLVMGQNATNKQAKSDLSEPGPRVFMNRPGQGGGRTFVEATKDSGFFQVRGGDGTLFRNAQVTSFGDVDNDGDLDAFSGTYTDPTNPGTDPGDRSEIVLNDGKGHFTLAPPSDAQPPKSALWPTTGATMVDADRDGKLDVFVGFWYASYGSTQDGVQAQLYRGAGTGAFTSITDAAGLKTQIGGYAQGLNHRPSYGVTSCDVDGDGSPELLVSAYGRQWNMLYQNDGSGKFTEVGQASGYAADGNTSYKDNQFFACYCTVHTTNADCQGVDAPITSCPDPADSYWAKGVDDQPWRNGGNTFATYCGDLDGDGKLDLYNAEIHHWHIGQSSDGSELLRNVSDGASIAFERPGNAVTGMSWPHPTSDWNEGGLMVAGGDFDGDGLEDVLVAASDYPDQFSLLFHQKPDHTFEEVGKDWGLHHACASGLTVADFDRDGDLDVIVGSGTARDCGKIWTTNEVHFYENKSPHTGHYLLVRLVGNGKDTNASAFGARVTMTAGGKQLVKELDGGYGHMGMQNDTVLFFGVGACDTVESIKVRWPNQDLTEETWTSVKTSRYVELRQGDPKPYEPLAK